jgi:hypothetical protein
MTSARPWKTWWLACLLLTGGLVSPVAAQEDLPPLQEPAAVPSVEETPPPDAPPPSQDTLLAKPLGPGTGPGLPWPVVLAGQLLVYAVADALPFVSCVTCSWGLAFLVPLGPGLPLAIFLTVLFIPPASLLSGCLSASALQYTGDRFGVQRGRLALVGLVSVALSFITYALVIAPTILGVGFFAVALVSLISASAILALPEYRPPGPPILYGALGYSVSALGAVLAASTLLLGVILAPVLGFVVRPVVVALAYRLTGRPRESGEEQWPPSLFGERADLWPFPWRKQSPPLPDETPPAPVSPDSPRY